MTEGQILECAIAMQVLAEFTDVKAEELIDRLNGLAWSNKDGSSILQATKDI